MTGDLFGRCRPHQRDRLSLAGIPPGGTIMVPLSVSQADKVHERTRASHACEGTPA
jgi:hypothetical protein